MDSSTRMSQYFPWTFSINYKRLRGEAFSPFSTPTKHPHATFHVDHFSLAKCTKSTKRATWAKSTAGNKASYALPQKWEPGKQTYCTS